MSEDTETMPIEDYLAQGGVLTSPANVPRPLPRRAPAADGDLRRQRARRLRRLRRHDQRPRPASPPASPPAASRSRRPTTPSASSTLMGDFGADEGRYATAPPLGRPPAARRLARPGPPRRRHAPRGLPLPDRGLDRRRRDERPAGPRRRRHPRRDVAASPTPRSPRPSAPSPRARQRHTELGLTGLTDIAATDEGRAAAEAAIAYWQPKVADSFGTATPPGSRR